MVKNKPKQGEIYKMNLNPRKGHEQQGYRPYLVLSHNLVSEYSNVAIVAPISNTERSYPFYIHLPPSQITTGKVLLDQLITIDYNARNLAYVESITNRSFMQETLSIAKTLFDEAL